MKSIVFSTLQFKHQNTFFMMHVDSLVAKENLHLVKVHLKSVANSLLKDLYLMHTNSAYSTEVH